MPASCGELGRPAGAAAAAAAESASFASWQQTARGDIAERLRRLHTGLLPAEIDHVAGVIVEESERADVSPELVLALIHVESSGYNFARSHAGALGLMQLRPATAEAVAKSRGIEWRGRDSLFDAGTNVRLGVTYLRQLIDRYGSVSTALAAYNWGPTRVSRMIRRGEAVPVVYPSRVLQTYDENRSRGA